MENLAYIDVFKALDPIIACISLSEARSRYMYPLSEGHNDDNVPLLVMIDLPTGIAFKVAEELMDPVVIAKAAIDPGQ